MEQELSSVWAQNVQSLEDQLRVDTKQGLQGTEAQQRLIQYGPNQIITQKQTPWYVLLIRQFNNLLVYLLSFAAIVSFFTGDTIEGVAIIAVLVINGVIGFVTEMKAIKSMEALRQLGESMAWVLRDGKRHHVLARDLVPGDVLLLEAGDVVTAGRAFG
jgi:Ca2+-transporting ATPase